MGFVIYMQGFVFSLALFALAFTVLGVCTIVGGLFARQGQFFAAAWRIWLWSSLGFAGVYAPCFIGAVFLFKWLDTQPKGGPAWHWLTFLFLLGPFLVPGAGFLAGVHHGMKTAMARQPSPA